MSRIAKLAPIVAPLSGPILFDDFNRADGAVGKAPTGQTWQDATTFAISSGKLVKTATFDNTKIYIYTGVDRKITFDAVVGKSTTFYLNMNATCTFGLLLTYDYSNKKFRLYKRENSKNTAITAAVTYTGSTGGTPYVVNIETDNKSYCNINGAAIVSGGSFYESTCDCFGYLQGSTVEPANIDNIKAEAQ